MALISKLEAIADAIREKTGGKESLTLEQMATEVGKLGAGEDFLAKLAGDSLIDYSSDEVTNIRAYLFYGNASLKSVSLTNAVHIRESAFYQCANLESANLPNLTHMYGQEVFGHCKSLTELSLPKLEKTYIYGFRYSSLQRVELDSVTEIEEYLFYNCSSLRYVYAPKIGKVKTSAFRGCTALEALVIEQDDSVCTLDATSAFTGSSIASGTGFVYVPDALVDAYKAASNWSTYAAQIKPISEYTG